MAQYGWWVLCLVPAVVTAQDNLVANPGFEDGTSGWSTFWSRETGAGNAAVVTEGAHEGKACLRIEHTGRQDWSWSQLTPLPVVPGDVLRLGGWMRVEKLQGDIQVSVILRDAGGEVISWAHGPATPGRGQDWQKVERRSAIPSNGATILFRIIGSGPCVAYVDDLFLTKEGNLSELRAKSSFAGLDLENRQLRVRLGPDLGIDVTDKRTNHTWVHSPGPTPWIVLSSTKTEGRVTLKLRDVLTDTEFTLKIVLKGAEVTFRLEPPAEAKLESEVLFPLPFLSRRDDYAVVPYAEGMVLPVGELDLQRDFWYAGYKSTMAWCGITDLKSGYLILPTTPADAGIRIRPGGPEGARRLALETTWIGEKGKWGYSREVVYAFFADGGYVAMCQRYRQWAEQAGYVKTLREKLTERPTIDRLIGAVDFWGSSGTNDAAFYRELRSLGIDRAICSLGGGWIAPQNVSGLVKELNDMGFLPSHYDIYTDVWPGKEDEEPRWARKHGYPEDVYVNEDGSLRKGWVIRTKDASYQGYTICSTQHAKEAIPRIAADLAENPYTCRFIDVVTATGPSECYSDAHPVTRTGDIRTKRDMLALVAGRFGLVTGSEECRDWAMAVADYGEGTMTIYASENAGYDWRQPVEPDATYLKLTADGRYRVPLHALCFHDCHVATWYTGDGSTKVPKAWSRKDLLNMLYGSMPLWMPDASLWRTYRRDLVCSYCRVCSVFRATGYDRMTSHAFLTPDRRVQQTRFADGTKVTANFGPEPHPLPAADSPTRAALKLPALGYAVTGPALGSYRAEIAGREVEYVETGDRALLVSEEAPYDGGAISAQGTVVVAHEAKGPFVLVFSGTGPVTLRENGPLAGRGLAKARVVGYDGAGGETAVASEAGPRQLTFGPVAGIERYRIIYR